ncbi:MAG: hypothetical protein CL466_08305 [Acidimicrobiaceae bacterium]|nr:hypothetical protein [Acidimicrobiaceae bacterium]|tara:strand:+ start:244 stop:1395 length:1152 start_codon:yes stop_codon:yes gene_type:complete
MKIALYGHFMYQLAAGLRAQTDHDVHLFLDSETIPTCLRDEPLLDDPTFATSAPWVGGREILRPGDAELARRLADYDVAIVTDLGPIFAERSGIPYVFFPAGWDLTHAPFPVRARSSRRRGRADVVDTVIGIRQRRGIRRATSIWGPAFKPFRSATRRLGVALGGCLPQAIDTDLFRPREPVADRTAPISVFHPARLMFAPDPFIIETGGWKRNDLLLHGFALAVADGFDGRLLLVEREGSSDENLARRLIDDLSISDRVDWLGTGRGIEFTWREIVDVYQACDISSDDFGGWFGLAALEGASCGRPVLNHLEPGVMKSEYPGGHPFVQGSDAESIRTALLDLADRDHREAVGRASRDWVMEHHDRGVVAERCVRMLEEIGLA